MFHFSAVSRACNDRTENKLNVNYNTDVIRAFSAEWVFDKPS